MVGDVMSYRDLSFPHDAVCTVSILFVLLGLVVTLLVAEQPQGLRALQLNLKLLQGSKKKFKKKQRILLCQKKKQRKNKERKNVMECNDKHRDRNHYS